MSGHTPGPWIDGGGNRHGGRFIRTPDDARGHHLAICDTFDVEVRHEQAGESAANARLIAEAPAMLAVLRDLLPLLEDEAEYDGDDDATDTRPRSLDAVRAILARIDGDGGGR